MTAFARGVRRPAFDLTTPLPYPRLMLSRTISACAFGIEAVLVEIEVDIRAGMPGILIVGLPDAAVREKITQLNIYGDTSIGGTGSIMVGDKKINITRIQLEEDPGRLIYEGSSSKNLITLVDYNRAGTPLVEIVTEINQTLDAHQ